MEIFNHQNITIYLLLSMGILILGCCIGLIFSAPSNTPFIFENTKASTMTSIQIFEYLIIKNLIAMFILISFGIIGTKIVPILCLLINGYNLGSTMSFLNYDYMLIFTTMFPHGYVEFPLLVFGGTCSFIIVEEMHKTGFNVFTLLKLQPKPQVRFILKNYLLYPYILIIIPGVCIAAAIEATFTLWNLKILVGA